MTGSRDASNPLILFERRQGYAPELSFIVPVYNTALYVRDTLDSLVSGNRASHEIIVVDDGSTDESLRVLTEWAANCSTDIVIVSQTNRGLGSARNTGLRFAHGDFVAFADSDDLFDGAVYASLIKLCRTHGSQVAIGGAICVGRSAADALRIWPFPDTSLLHACVPPSGVVTTTAAREPRLLRLEPNANRSVIKRSLLDETSIRFPEGLLFEDFPFHAKLMAVASSVTLSTLTLLYYLDGRPGQITKEKGQRRFDILTICQLLSADRDILHLPIPAGAALIGQVTRAVYWCGTHVPRGARNIFFQKACRAITAFPAPWIMAYLESDLSDLRERLICSALAGDVPDFLVMATLGERNLIPAVRLGLSRYGKPIRGRALELTRHRVREALPRPFRRQT